MSYEEALATLCSMFQSWDRDTIIAIFESNGYHVERTIETILSMEQTEGSQETQPNANSQPVESLLDFAEIDLQPTRREERARGSNTIPKPQIGQRGMPCVLPDDFLRLPSQSAQCLQDEQLALLLQNELFQREIEQALGSEYLNNLYPPSYQPTRQRQQPHLAQGSPANIHQPHHHPPQESIPDLGILKALQDVGEGMRSQLNQLAIQFNATAAAALETIEGKRSRSNSTAEREKYRGDPGETHPLTAGDYEEEEDEEGPLMGAGNSSASRNNLTRRQTGKKDK